MIYEQAKRLEATFVLEVDNKGIPEDARWMMLGMSVVKVEERDDLIVVTLRA